MTRRQNIIAMLEKEKLSAQQLTSQFKCEMWEIVEDLKHIGKTVYPRLKREHPYCEHCGYFFRERSRIKAPSKCPSCKGESIIPSRFYIDE